MIALLDNYSMLKTIKSQMYGQSMLVTIRSVFIDILFPSLYTLLNRWFVIKILL